MGCLWVRPWRQVGLPWPVHEHVFNTPFSHVFWLDALQARPYIQYNAFNVQHPRVRAVIQFLNRPAPNKTSKRNASVFVVWTFDTTTGVLVLNQRGDPGHGGAAAVHRFWGADWWFWYFKVSTSVLLIGEEEEEEGGRGKVTHARYWAGHASVLTCSRCKKKQKTKTKSGVSSPRGGRVSYSTSAREALVTTGSTGQQTGNVTRTSAQLLQRTARRSPVWGSGRWWGTLGRPAGEAQQVRLVYIQGSYRVKFKHFFFFFFLRFLNQKNFPESWIITSHLFVRSFKATGISVYFHSILPAAHILFWKYWSCRVFSEFVKDLCYIF